MAKRSTKTSKATIGNLAEQKSSKIPLEKYFQLHDSGIHEYTRAYLVEKFRDILNTKEEWTKEIKN